MKTESIAEFLARGGKITKVPAHEPVAKKSESVKSIAAGGPASLMTLDQADLFYGEHKKRKVKPKAVPTLDVDALPPELRKKYVDDVIDAYKKEEGIEDTRDGGDSEDDEA